MPPPPLKNATLRANEMIKLSKKNIVIGGERGGCCEELGFDMAREKGYPSCAHFVKVTQDFYDYFIVECVLHTLVQKGSSKWFSIRQPFHPLA